jgi:hypothetical protein
MYGDVTRALVAAGGHSILPEQMLGINPRKTPKLNHNCRCRGPFNTT